MRAVAASGIAAIVLVTGCGGSDEPRPAPALRMLDARAAHTATALLDGSVLLAGGCDTGGCSSATAHTELFRGGRFRQGPALRTARDGHTATRLADGGVLLVGGFEREGTAPLASTELFRAGRTRAAAPLHSGRGGQMAVALGDGRVLVAGGLGADGLLRSAELFDPRRGGWHPAAPLARARGSATATLLRDGTVLVTGGIGHDGAALASSELFDPRTGRWRAGPRLREPRGKHAAVALHDGRVLVVGGAADDEHGSELRSAELYDPRARRWSAAGSMAATRYKITDAVALLRDGRVLVAGGAPTVEVFDPATGRFRTLRRTGARRLFATATALPDGRTLVAGGYDDEITPSASVALVG